MVAPVNPYAAPLSVDITESFEAEVNVIDEMSLSNSSSLTTPSQMSAKHQLGQMVAKPDDPQAAALNDVCQETVDFTDDGPPSL